MAPMSPIDLIILGILYEKPMNAYEVARFVDEKHVQRLVKISQPAIYKNCKKLFQAGYLTGEKVRQGENPEKTIFKLSAKGKTYFHELMAHFSSRVHPFYLDFNAFIWNLDRLPKAQGLEMLENLRRELAQLKIWIINHEIEAAALRLPVRLIIKQGRMVIVALAQWAEEAVADFKKYKK